MKLATGFALAALLVVPATAMAQKSNTLPNQPGQSEFAPGQRAKHPGDATKYAPGQKQTAPGTAKNFAPGQQMHTKNVKGQTNGTVRH
jgi:hypothetical protein